MDRRKHTIPLKSDGARLDVALLELLGEDFSRARVQALIKEELVLLDGLPSRSSQKVKGGQRVEISVPEPEPIDLTPETIPLQVLFEDDDLIVVNKPPGLVVHPSPGHFSHTLVHGLLARCPLAQVGGKLRPGIVHRLDKDTSGAIIAAKSDMAHRRLVAAFAAGRVKKTYLALVWGSPPAEGRIDQGIGRHPVDRKRMSTKSRSVKSAVTVWRVLKRCPQGMSLLRVGIKTGRTHQIRVHLAEEGFPVVGDSVYGARRGRGKRSPGPGPLRDALEQSGRQLLHALELSFPHPLGKGPVRVLAPLPEDFRKVLHTLHALKG